MGGIIPSKYFLKAKNLETDQWLDMCMEAGPVDLDSFAEWKSEKLRRSIREQVEFYFGKENYDKNEILRTKVDGDGWIDLRVIAGLNRLQRLSISEDLAFLRECLANGSGFELSSDGERIRQFCSAEAPMAARDRWQ